MLQGVGRRQHGSGFEAVDEGGGVLEQAFQLDSSRPPACNPLVDVLSTTIRWPGGQSSDGKDAAEVSMAGQLGARVEDLLAEQVVLSRSHRQPGRIGDPG